MQRALPLVASLFLSCAGSYGSLSMPMADRLHPDTAGAAPLLPFRVPVDMTAGDGNALQLTASGNFSVGLDGLARNNGIRERERYS